MSTSIKWIIGIVLVAAVAGGLWKSGLFSQPAQQPAADTSGTAQNAPINTGLPTSQADTTDTAMAQDAAALDAQINALSQDSTAVHQSLSDTPVSQSY